MQLYRSGTVQTCKKSFPGFCCNWIRYHAYNPNISKRSFQRIFFIQGHLGSSESQLTLISISWKTHPEIFLQFSFSGSSHRQFFWKTRPFEFFDWYGISMSHTIYDMYNTPPNIPNFDLDEFSSKTACVTPQNSTIDVWMSFPEIGLAQTPILNKLNRYSKILVGWIFNKSHALEICP